MLASATVQPLEINAISAMQWYVVHCVGARDEQAANVCYRVGWEFYQPKCKELRAVPLRRLSPIQRKSALPVRRPVDVPLFPRYPFIRFDLNDPKRHEIFDILGIQGLICSDGTTKPQPHIIKQSLIDAFKGNEIEGSIPYGITMEQIRYKVGEVVRINAGPFATFNGIVEKLADKPIGSLDADDRIKLLVDLFGGKTSVELSLSDIEKL